MAIETIQNPTADPGLEDGRKRKIGNDYRRWVSSTFQDHATALQALGRGTVVATPVYGPAVKIDLNIGTTFEVNATDGNAFQITTPVNVGGLSGWELSIYNGSGGALGAVTFGAGIKEAGFVPPGPGQFTTTRFYISASTNPPTHVQMGNWSTPA